VVVICPQTKLVRHLILKVGGIYVTGEFADCDCKVNFVAQFCGFCISDCQSFGSLRGMENGIKVVFREI
jgi:hypothetical protein